MRLDRTAVVEYAAAHPGVPLLPLLERLSGRAVPGNVAVEIRNWCGHAKKLTLYEGMALVEVRHEAGLLAEVKQELGELVIDGSQPGFLLAREPDRVISVLEAGGRVPTVYSHRADHFVACEGVLRVAGKEPAPGRREDRAPVGKPRSPRQKAYVPGPVNLLTQQLVGYRSDDLAFLQELHRVLEAEGIWCHFHRKEGLMVVAAGDLSRVQTALRQLQDGTAGTSADPS